MPNPCCRIPPVMPMIVLVLCLGAAGCGGDHGGDPGPGEPAPIAEGVIGPAGGALAAADIELIVPEGALADETTLRIFAEDQGPFGPAAVYRVGGLPAQFASPLNLRVRVPAAKVGALTALLAQLGESSDEGRTTSWEIVAGAEQDGWYGVVLPQGPQDLGEGVADGDLRVTVLIGIRDVQLADGHFRLFYVGADHDEADVIEMAATFEAMHGSLQSSGFTFGDQDTIWPLSVFLRPPATTIGEFVAAPHAAGHFNLHPDLLLQPQLRNVVVLHEVFHLAQSFYDPRPSSQWGSLNRERLWLDEATASWLEETALDEAGYCPYSLTDDLYGAALSGIGGHPELADNLYGYGMSTFIKELVGRQGEDVVREIYEAFAATGGAVPSLMTVIDPPLSTWCGDFQRRLVTGEVYPGYDADVYWWAWPIGGYLSGSVGTNRVWSLEVRDYGADVRKLVTRSELPPQDAVLKIRLLAGSTRPEPPLRLAAYGRADGYAPVLLASGTDSLTIREWRDVYAQCDDLLVQVVKSWSDDEAAGASTTATVEVEVEPGDPWDPFETAMVSVRYRAQWSNGVVPWQGLNLVADNGTWSGTVYSAAWDSVDAQDVRFTGSFAATVDPVSGDLTGFAASSRWTYPQAQTYNDYQIVASGTAPLQSQGANERVYGLNGPAVCGFVASIAVTMVADGEVTRQLQSWSCDQDSYLTFRLRDDR